MVPAGVAPWLVHPAGGVPAGVLEGPIDPQTAAYWFALHLSTGLLNPSPQLEQVTSSAKPKHWPPPESLHWTRARSARQPPGPASSRPAGQEHSVEASDSAEPVPPSRDPEQAPASNRRETSSLGAIGMDGKRMGSP